MTIRVILIFVLAIACTAQEDATKPSTSPDQPQQPAATVPAETSKPIAPPTTAPTGSTTDAKAAVTDAKATVYVYRYKQFVGSALEPSVYCDDTQVARMDNGRYFILKVPAGKHMIRSNDKQAGLEVDFKGGQDYYVRIEIAAGMMKGHGRVILMAPEQGSYEIKKLKPLADDKIVDKTLVVGAKVGM